MLGAVLQEAVDLLIHGDVQLTKGLDNTIEVELMVNVGCHYLLVNWVDDRHLQDIGWGMCWGDRVRRKDVQPKAYPQCLKMMR